MDVKITIDGKKGIDYQFRSTLDLREFNEIKNNFRRKFERVAEISKPNWWYKKSDFGLFFLEYMRHRQTVQMEKLPITSEEDWREFYPVFKNFFPTLGEYIAIKNNIGFWHGHTEKVIEDSYFVKWVILEKYGYLDYKSICTMPFKEIMMIYYYGILGKIFSNAAMYARRGILPPEDEEEEGDMFR